MQALAIRQRNLRNGKLFLTGADNALNHAREVPTKPLPGLWEAHRAF